MGNDTLDKNDDISLKDIILILGKWRNYFLSKWLIILIAGVLGGGIGFIYAYLKKPIYLAELSFALDDDKSTGVDAVGLASQLGLGISSSGGGAFSGDNLLDLMKSRSVVEKTLLTPVVVNGRSETLAEYYISCNNLRNSWANNSTLKNISFLPDEDRSKFTLAQDSILGEFHRQLIASGLSVERKDKKLSIINVSVASANELFSKLFVETLTKTVSDFYVETKTKKSAQNVSILQHQTDSIRRELDHAINGVASSMDAIPNANPQRQVLHAASLHKDVDVQADKAILTELVRNLEVAKVSLRKETPLIQIIDRPILPLAKIKPRKSISLAIGGVIAVMISILLLFFIKLYAELKTKLALN